MSHRHYYLNIFLLYIIITISLSEKLYTHYDYDHIFQAFTELSKTCSNYIKIDTSQSRYNLDSVEGCGENKPCLNLIVFLTDFDSYTLDRPTYYISSAIHGDEVIGSSSLVEFAKYFCDSYNSKKNSLYHHILKNKLIVMTPMTNAYGYYHKRRDDRIYIESKKRHENADPNRDFPYFNSREETKNCMRTLSARTINEIFNEFIVSGSITFHGGDNVLSYPWGNYLHITKVQYHKKSTESPDFNAFNNIGKIMVKFSSSEKNKKNEIPSYGFGDMTSTVYPLDGALEDWAYGGWEKYESDGSKNINPIKTCKPDSFNKNYNMLWDSNNSDNKEFNDDYKLRCIIYLAEASYNKMPQEKYYGINDFDINGTSRDIFDFYNTNDFYGHVPRNMRLVYSGVDLISSSIYLDYINIQKIVDEKNLMNIYTIPFIFMGCLSLKKYSIYKLDIEHITKDVFQKDYIESNLNPSTLISEFDSDIKCYYTNINKSNYNFTISIPFNNNKATLRNLEKDFNPLHHFDRPGGDYDHLGNTLGVKLNNLYTKNCSMYIIRGEGPDEDWGNQENPDPKVKPQSHVVRSKLNKNYFVKNGNHTLKSNYYFYSYPIISINDDEKNNLRIIDDIDSFFYEDEFNMMKLIINSNNNQAEFNSLFRFHKKNNNNLLTSENIFDVDVKIDIHLNQKKNNLINDNDKNVNLISTILFNDGTKNDLNCFCNPNSKNYIYIKCDILKEKNGAYIRQKLPNSILKFDMQQKDKTIWNFYGIISFDNDNKGKYLDDKLMICTNNYPFFIQNEKEKYYSSDNIYYKINIERKSNTNFKIKFDLDVNDSKYKNYVYLVFFPFCEEIFFFNENFNDEKEINIKENSDSKIIGKTVHVIPLEKSDYKKIQKSENKLINNNNDILNLTLEISKITKNPILSQTIPCSIISNNSFTDDNYKIIMKDFISEFDINNNRKKINFHFVFVFLSCIIPILIIIYIINKKCENYYNKFHSDNVEISSSSNS